MMRTRKRLAVVLGVMGVLAIGGPVASASAATTASVPMSTAVVPQGLSAFDGAPLDPGGCADVSPSQGTTGGTQNQICQGSGLAFVGPSVGQVATVIGPTVIGPANIGNLIASAGSVAAG